MTDWWLRVVDWIYSYLYMTIKLKMGEVNTKFSMNKQERSIHHHE